MKVGQPGLVPSGLLQRKPACGCQCGGKGGCKHQQTLQRKSQSQDETSSETPESIDQVLSSTGMPLDAGSRAWMEPRFGHDFSRVRVHSDVRAAESARAVNANAFTVGSDIVFAEGQYAPHTASGGALLAHELGHVVQQSKQPNQGTFQGDLTVSAENDPAEHEADAASARVMRGQTVDGLSQVSKPSLHRQPAGTPNAPANAAPAAPAPQATTNPPPKENLQFGTPNATFDAALDRTKCEIVLTKKIRFDFLNEPPANTWGTGYAPWPEGKAEEWQNNFITAVTARWSGKHLLVPTAACPSETCKSFKASVRVIPVDSGEHTTMEIGFLTGAFEPLEMGVSPMGDRARLHSGELSPRKTEGHTQIPAEHEFGHMLGRSHVNAASCGSDVNNVKCYGETEEQMENIMGRGSAVSAADYAPFAFAVGQFNSCSWKAQEAEGASGWEIFGWTMLGLAGAAGIGLGIAAGAGAFDKKA